MPREGDIHPNDAACLLDMLNAAKAVQSFVNGRTYDEYINDLLLRSAVERQIEIVGEATRGLSQSFKDAHPEIPWRQIIAQRHRLAHEYGVVNDAMIWTVATAHVPRLMEQIQPLVPPPE
jgi:uncharacterized protein with HEPN domain